MPKAQVTNGSIVDATRVTVQQCELLNGSLAPQGEGSSIPAKGQCRSLWVWVCCPCPLLCSALQEPGCWRSLKSTKAMTEKLRVYGKKRMGWMAGGIASPSTDPVSLGSVQQACLAHVVRHFCSHVVWELRWGPRSRLCPSCPAPKSRQVESAGPQLAPVRGEGEPQVLAAPQKSGCGYTAWARGRGEACENAQELCKSSRKR